MTKDEAIQKIISLMEEKGWIAVFYDANQPNVHNTRVTSVFKHDGQYRVSAANDTCYRVFSLDGTHSSRLERMVRAIEQDTISGYTDANGISKFHNGFETDKPIKQFVKENGNLRINTSNEDWKFCTHCGRLIYDVSEGMTVHNNTICSKCKEFVKVVKCAICNQDFFDFELRTVYLDNDSRQYFKTTDHSLKVCNNCKNENFERCNACGNLQLKALHKECDCRNHRVLDYCYKPNRLKLLGIKKTNKKTLFIGFENECECEGNSYSECDNCSYCRGDDECDECDYYDTEDDKSEYVETLVSKLGKNVYCKEDGSLDNGFEIVTEPMTYDYILANQQKFREAFKELSNSGVYSYKSNNTGFHIHLSRAAFKNDKHLINFARVIYEDPAFSSAIALRPGNSYCYYLNEKEHKIMDDTINKLLTECSRYRAVNFCNTNTVEVRIYKGNLLFDSCLVYIQHAVSVFHYTALMTKLNSVATVQGYIDYVGKRGRIYKELKNKIAKILKGGK